MNEKILLRFFHADTPVDITSVDPAEGIVLGGETSAFPITGGLAIFPARDAVSQSAYKRISMVEDWRDGKFPVKVSRQGNTLVLTGAGKQQPEKSLPAIGYELSVRMKDTKLRESQFSFRVPAGGTREVEIRVEEPRQVKFTPLKDYDEQTRQIVTNAQSVLDGAPVVEWFARPTARTVRKVCLLNLLAHLRALPDTRDSLSGSVQAVALADVDRIAVNVDGSFLARMRELTKGREPAFGEDGGPIHPTHFRTRDRVVGAAGAGYKLHSFRQRVSKRSMQIIVSEPPAGAPQPVHFAEIDIDLGNPFIDAVGFGTHLFELMNPAATDHFDLAKSVPLDFRYYSFVKGAESV